jgi:hypothetical protein
MQAHACADRHTDACADIESYALADRRAHSGADIEPYALTDACADVSTLTLAVGISVRGSVINVLEPQPRTHRRNITIAVSNPVVVH